MTGSKLDFSHTIKHISFGNETDMNQIKERYNDNFVFDLDNTTVK